MAPIVEDMLCHGRTVLTETIVTGPGWAVLFYGRWSLGESLRLVEVRDAMFTLSEAGTWVGKLAYIAADPLTIQGGWWAITQAITEHWIEVKGPGQPHSHLLTPQLFRFHCPGDSPWKECSRDTCFDHQPLPHRPQRCWDFDQCQRDQMLIKPQPPSPDHGFESNRSSVSTASLVSSQSDRSEGSQHSQHGRQCRETGANMKINLPAFKDEDTKGAVIYQSWRWDLTVCHCAGCQDCTLLPYAIRSLQGYPRELVRSLGMDITLDNVLTVLDKHYNNVKALDALNQELFQLWMADKETISDWGIHLSRHLQVLATSFPECFPLNWVAKLKFDHFYGRLPKWLKAMVAYLKASPQEKTYSKYLWAAREAEKEDSMELSQSRRSQATNNTTKPKVTSFFPWQKLRGTQLTVKTAPVHLAHLEEESAKRGKEVESEDPDSIDRVMEEFMVHLAGAVKDTQMEEKCCYHCSSLENFIHDCPLVKTSVVKSHLNCKEGMAPKKGARPLRWKLPCQVTPGGGHQGVGWCMQTPFLNPDAFQHWYGVKNIAKVKINKESCMALLNNGAQINTIMPTYVKSCSLEVGLISNLIGRQVTCVGLGNAYTWPLGYVIIKIHMDGVQGYNEDQIALVVPDLLNFVVRIPIRLGTPTISHIVNVYEGEGNRCLGNTLGKCPYGPSLVSMKGCSHSGRWPRHGRVQSRWVWWSGHH